MEVLLVFVIRGPYSRGISWPVTLVGVLAAVLLIIGYVPLPFELWKRRGRVVGIDFGFLTIDWFGAFFSLMAIGKCVVSLMPGIRGLKGSHSCATYIRRSWWGDVCRMVRLPLTIVFQSFLSNTNFVQRDYRS